MSTRPRTRSSLRERTSPALGREADAAMPPTDGRQALIGSLSAVETGQGTVLGDGQRARAADAAPRPRAYPCTRSSSAIQKPSTTKPRPPNATLLEQIATLAGGRSFPAPTAVQLEQVWEDLGSRVATATGNREIPVAFVAGQLAVMGLAGAVALSWFRRLP